LAGAAPPKSELPVAAAGAPPKSDPYGFYATFPPNKDAPGFYSIAPAINPPEAGFASGEASFYLPPKRLPDPVAAAAPPPKIDPVAAGG